MKTFNCERQARPLSHVIPSGGGETTEKRVLGLPSDLRPCSSRREPSGGGEIQGELSTRLLHQGCKHLPKRKLASTGISELSSCLRRVSQKSHNQGKILKPLQPGLVFAPLLA